MRHELLWFIRHVENSDGIHMLESVEWSPYDKIATTLIAYADASAVGMGFGFRANMPVFNVLFLRMVPRTSYSSMRPSPSTLLSTWVLDMAVIGLRSTRITRTLSTCSLPSEPNQPITQSSCPPWILTSKTPSLPRFITFLANRTLWPITFEVSERQSVTIGPEIADLQFSTPSGCDGGRQKMISITRESRQPFAALDNGPLNP